MTASSLFLFGTDEPVPETRTLTAGRLTAGLVEGALRNVRFDGVEVLRAIAYVVRDKDWGTYSPSIQGLRVGECDEGFTVAYDALCEGPNGEKLRYRSVIRAGTDSTLSFSVDATPESDFLTNRCGFSVLHPIVGVAGRPVEIEHTDGLTERSVFPDLIAPWQPFMDIRAITHSPASGIKATCRMEGDIFEMEDQRAWSDASYKTYVRPLALPWPYLLPGGVAMRQSVTLSVQADHAAAEVSAYGDAPIPIALKDAAGVLPGIGLVITPDETTATLAQLERLSDLDPQQLLLHFDPVAGHGVEALKGFAELLQAYGEAASESSEPIASLLPSPLVGEGAPRVSGGRVRGNGLSAKLPLTRSSPKARTTLSHEGRGEAPSQSIRRDAERPEIVLECVVPGIGDPAAELADIASFVRAAGLKLDAIAVSPSVDRQSTPPGSLWPTCPPLEDIYDAARKSFPGQKIGGGMFSYFTELNRKRVPAHLLDFVTHCTNPIVHAADDLSVMQTLEALPAILRSTRAIIGEDKPYRIGPSTIGMRQNPYGSRTMPNLDGRRITMAAVDPRQGGQFAAAWMVGYVARLVEAGVENFTVGALTGPLGLLRRDGSPTPAFFAAQMLATIGGAQAIKCHSGDESRLLGLAGMNAYGQRVLLLANLTDELLSVVLPEIPRGVTLLDEASGGCPQLRDADGAGLSLGAYAVARVVLN